jgi:hypothetical protein
VIGTTDSRSRVRGTAPLSDPLLRRCHCLRASWSLSRAATQATAETNDASSRATERRLPKLPAGIWTASATTEAFPAGTCGPGKQVDPSLGINSKRGTGPRKGHRDHQRGSAGLDRRAHFSQPSGHARSGGCARPLRQPLGRGGAVAAVSSTPSKPNPWPFRPRSSSGLTRRTAVPFGDQTPAVCLSNRSGTGHLVRNRAGAI